ncbi:MAG TPA: LLM class flavin-dependent oxidoreductase [Solirubrobacterales bacterium]
MGSFGIKLENHLTLPENVALARRAEEAGLDSVWIGEYRAEAVVPMAAFAMATERLLIGSAAIQLYTRSAPVLAMTVASLAELAPGRIALGLGSSTNVIIERWHGLERRKPLLTMAESITSVREILEGGRVSFAGERVSVDDFRLERGAANGPIPIYAAALGEKMLALAGRHADGVLLNAYPFDHIPAIRRLVEEASAAAGRPPGAVRLAGDLRIGIADDTEQLQRMRTSQRKAIAYYAKLAPYNRFFAEAGFERQAAAIREAWAVDDRPRAVAAVDDEMLDQIVVVGGRQEVRDRLSQLAVDGLDSSLVFPLWEGDDPAAATEQILAVVAEVAA